MNGRDGAITDRLDHWASSRRDQIAYIYLRDGETEQDRWTFSDLRRRALAIGARLQEQIAPGDRALLAYSSGLDFIAAFLGCLYAGVVAVPVNVPRRTRFFDKFCAVVLDCRPRIALTTMGEKAQLDDWLVGHPQVPDLSWSTTDSWMASEDMPAAPATRPHPEGLAFIQYTSGSTGDPKGVMVSNANLMANEAAIKASFGHSDSSVFVGWLPLFHDMGLIGNVLQPLYLGIASVLMSPVDFLQKPARWLQAISKYGGTTGGAPNFGYELCTSKVRDDQMEGVTLATWDVAYNGAEPVRAHTLEQFSARFARYGFKRSAFYPCYGMAEVTLFATGGKKGHPEERQVDMAALERGQSTAPTTPTGHRLVSCGWAWPEHQIIIVDPSTCQRSPDGQVGEIWFQGPSVALGYWERAEKNTMVFGARPVGEEAGPPFLRTGDLGFLSDGRLFVTGRLKDLIIVRGANHYPQDIELTAERCHPALASGGGAAFAVRTDGAEQVVVIHEVELTRRHVADARSIRQAVQEAVATNHGLSVAHFVLLQPKSLPRTSSGKVQRGQCRRAFLEGSLSEFKAPERQREGHDGDGTSNFG